MGKNYEMHVISHSHWDREWRYSFAETSLDLVEMMDRLFEVLDNNPDYKYYHLDAHTILLEDYLELCPAGERKLRRYIEQGRILVGPWYTLPEQFVVSGESLVRNLLIGHQVAQKFGNVMKVGYTPTSCGQISQLPQIYGGFGIDNVLFYRGMNPHEEKAEFIWEAPDGTRALAFHFYSHGRANFFSLILYPVLFGAWREFGLKEVKEHFHLTTQRYPYVNYTTDALTAYHGENLAPALKNTKTDAISKATTRFLLYMDGCDNGAPHPYTARIIKDANKISEGDRYVHSNLPAYVEKVRKSAKNLNVVTGEMRRQGKTMANAVYSGVISARMYLKQLNARSEYNLTGRAEPWATIAWLAGAEYPKGQLEKAWRYLLANHTHDGMEACSADPVHDDMEYRFKQCDELSLGILRRSLCHIVKQMPPVPGNELTLIVFNPLPYPRTEVVSATLNLPAVEKMNVVRFTPSGDLKEEIVNVPNDERINTFCLCDGNREVPYEIVSQERRSILVERLEINTHQFLADRFTIRFFAEDVPAMGYKIYRLVPVTRRRSPRRNPGRSPRTMDNDHLSVRINDDGSLRIKDKHTGRIYNKLHVFEDLGEVGDSLWHRPPDKDKPITSLNGKAAVSLEREDRFGSTYRITVKLSLPAKAAPDGTRRVRQTKPMIISSLVTLNRNSRRVDVVTTFDNQIRDHRLRVLFPTGINTNHSWAAGQFDVLRRPIKSPHKKGWAEEKITTHPNYSFVDVSDGKAGLAVLNEGLTEYQVFEDRKRTIALTLVRSFEKICGVPACENVGGQCLRRLECRYAIYPHGGDYQQGNVFAETQRFNLPLEAAQSGRRGGPLGDEASFFRLEPDCLILSALKRSEDGRSVILRFFNPTLKKVKATITCFKNIKQAWETDLNEQRQRKLKLQNNRSVIISAVPKRIITLEIVLSRTHK